MSDGFFKCDLCGKKLLRRLPNGLWEFAFGRFTGESGVDSSLGSIVQMKVYGSLKMKCLRKRCREKNPNHWIILNFFPIPKEETQSTNVEKPAEIK